MRIFSKINVLTALQSILFLSAGVLCLTIPNVILKSANIITGISIIVFALSEIALFLLRKEYKTESFTLAYALITIAIGIIFLSIDIIPPISIILSLWVLISSVFKFINAINDSLNKCSSILKYGDATITLALGILLVIRFYEGVHATMIVLGIYLIYIAIKSALSLIRLDLTRNNSDKDLDRIEY